MWATFSLAAVLLALTVSPIHAGIVDLPNADAGTVGNDSSGSLALSFPSLDVQDIWDKSQFASFGSAQWITQLAFRLKPDTRGIDATVSVFL